MYSRRFDRRVRSLRVQVGCFDLVMVGSWSVYRLSAMVMADVWIGLWRIFSMSGLR